MEKTFNTKNKLQMGFKLVPIKSTDNHLHWNKQLKAMRDFVPIEHVDKVKYEISYLFLPEEGPAASNPYCLHFSTM